MNGLARDREEETTGERPGGLAGQARPAVIQGGMGVGVSGWPLARAVARTGQLGVVSGVALDATPAGTITDPDVYAARTCNAWPTCCTATALTTRRPMWSVTCSAADFRPLGAEGPARAGPRPAAAAGPARTGWRYETTREWRR